jgi:acetylornithine deacetylase/succinyl-diaminopimelate desuccinylase-like protein
MRAVLILAALSGVAHADVNTTTFARQLLDELVAIDTSNPPGNEEKAAKHVAAKLRAAGIEATLVPFGPGRANLVARLKGDGTKRPLILLAHLDVVGAAGQPWSTPPFTVTEKDGWLYGRGVTDDKSWAAMATAIVIELKKSRAPLRRDVILALTGDEESGGAGIRYILDHKRELLGDAEFALNEGGGVTLDAQGKARLVSLGTAEKTFQDYQLTTHGTGGHSSVPNDENAIYRMTHVLDKLAAYRFPTHLTPAVRDSLRATAVTQPEGRARAMRAAADLKSESIPPELLSVMDQHPLVRALTRTTCVATMLSGGTRDNALPVEAKAMVNCRIMPVETIESVRDTLAKIAGGLADVEIVTDFGIGPEVPFAGPVREAVEKATRAVWGTDVPVIGRLGLGASDSRFLRKAGIASYGVGVMAKPDEMTRNAHGPDEAAPASSFPLGVAFLRTIVRELVL